MGMKTRTRYRVTFIDQSGEDELYVERINKQDADTQARLAEHSILRQGRPVAIHRVTYYLENGIWERGESEMIDVSNP
jgi:hypothetical protein